MTKAVLTLEMDLLPPEATAELKQIPAVVDLFARWAVQDFQIVLNISAEMSSHRAEDKLLGYFRHLMLIALKNVLADPKAIHGQIEWPISISELARFHNMSRPLVSKIISHPTDERLIQIENRRLTIFPPQ